MPTVDLSPATAAALQRLRAVIAEGTTLATGTLTPLGGLPASDDGDMHQRLAHALNRVFGQRDDLMAAYETARLDLIAALAVDALGRRGAAGVGGSR